VSSERDRILSLVKKALAPLPKRALLPDWESQLILQRPLAMAPGGWELFSQRFAAVNGKSMTSPTELVGLLYENSWLYGYCEPRLWPLLEGHFPWVFSVDLTYDRSHADDYSFGITSAAGAIAETGTLILTDRGTSARLAALAPWVHVAIVSPEHIYPDIPSALAAHPSDPNIVWVTGPSKTADVEGILIEGVHGPGIQIALLQPSGNGLKYSPEYMQASSHIEAQINDSIKARYLGQENDRAES
jgi:L-lactate dehydrogenase complex protein LldG